MRVFALLAFVSLFAACGDKEAVCDLTEANECSVELVTGDLLRVKLPPAAFVESDGPGGGTQYSWGPLPSLNEDLLVWADEVADIGGGDETEFLLKAAGPGMETVRWAELSVLPEPRQSRYMEVTITGEPIGDAGTSSYLQGIAVAGGLGTSVESGSSLRSLSLRPTDIFAQGDELFVVSEGRLWSIDTAASVGSIEIDSTAAGTAWPAGGTLVSMSPLDAGGYIALIGLGTSISVVQIAANLGSFTELYSATSIELRPDCTTCQEGVPVVPGRIRASGDGTNWVASADSFFQIRNGEVFGRDAQGRTGHLVDANGEFVPADQDGTGTDHLGRVLFWASGGGATGGTSLSMYSGGQAVNIFTFIGTKGDRVDRETDFLPFTNGGAAVVGLSDGTYWSHTFTSVMTETMVTTGPRGLFVHRP